MSRALTVLAALAQYANARTRWIAAVALVCLAGATVRAEAYPFIEMYPGDGSYPVGYQVLVRVEFCETNGYFDTLGEVTVNGNVVAYAVPGSKDGCVDFKSLEVYVTLDSASNVVAASISSYSGGGVQVARYFVTPPYAPGIGLDPHNGHHWSPALCEAACFNTIVTYGTPAYWSLDAARSVTLAYSSGQLGDRHTIQVDAWNATPVTPDKMSLRLRRADATYVTFTNGATELFFEGRSGTQRLAAQFQDTTLATGAYYYTVVVRGYWNGDFQENTAALRLLVLNERTSPFGAGWSVAGVPRIVTGPGDSLVVTDGAGGIEFWSRTGCASGVCHYAPPAGTFDSLDSHGTNGDALSHWRPYRRRFIDGSSVYFHGDGRVAEAEDRFGNLQRYVWSGSPQRLDSIVDPAGKAIVFGYDGSNRLSWIRDVPGNRTTSVTVNSANDLVQIQDPVGGTPFQQASYDASHRLVSHADRRGGQWYLYYDFAGKIASDSTPTVTAADTVRRLGTRYRSPESAVLIDPASGLGSWSSPATPKTDSAGLATVVPAGGAALAVRVDAYGAVLDVLSPASAYAHYTRNAHGQLLTALDSTGSRSYSWSGPRLTSEANTVTNQTVTTEWNTTYSLVTRRYGAGAPEVRNWYGASGQLDSTRVGGEPASRFTSDTRGRVLTATDPRGHTTSYYGDGTALLNTDSVTAGVRRTRFRYDALGRVVHVSGPGGQTDSTVYDALNRVVRKVRPLNDTTAFAYTDSLNLTRVTDALGQAYQFTTNAVGWVTSETDPNSYSNSYMHDRGGRVIRWTNRRGQQTTFAYDTLGRLAGRGLSGGRTDSFEYHALFTVATNGEGSDTLRVVEDTSFAIAVRGGYPYTVRSRYDRTARETRLAVWGPGQTPLETVYQIDSTSRLRAVLPPGAEADSLRHNTDGLLTSVDLHGAASLTHAFRPRDDLARVAYAPTALQTAFGVEFVHDSLGRVVERRSGDRTQFDRYAYDALGHLRSFRRYTVSPACAATDTTSELGSLCTSGTPTLVAQDTFAYDLVGNRTDSSATVDWGNRQRSLRAYRLSYDVDGNVVLKSNQDSTFVQNLYWSSANELDSVRTWSQGAWQSVRFGYDAFGQRVRKTTSAGTTYYVWAAGQVVAEYEGNGNLLRHYTYYAGTDQPHSVQSGGARHYFAGDGRGNVLGLFNVGGSTVEAQYQFSPFGVTEAATGTVTNAVRFSGRELDSETGLYYNRARYYDPQLGRFLSEDPAGLAAGVNPYRYAGNDPVNSHDPSGLDCKQILQDPKAMSAPPVLASGGKGGDPYWALVCDGSSEDDWFEIAGYLGGGFATGYAHLSGYAVQAWDFVGRGQLIGYAGHTPGLPYATGSHLHFELYVEGLGPVDPMQYVWDGTLAHPLGDLAVNCRSRCFSAVDVEHPGLGVMRPHYGTDLPAWEGQPVYAAERGLVVEAKWRSGYGNYIGILHFP